MHICLEFRYRTKEPLVWVFDQNTHRRDSNNLSYSTLEYFIEKMSKADLKSLSAFIKRLPHDSAPFSLLESWIRE
jgi:hypothetical protein